MLRALKENCVTLQWAQGKSPEELAGKTVIGELLPG
jgi:hypothetical protein